MSWRDRDYARLREDERRALFGGVSSGPARTYRKRRTATPSLVLAVAISAIAIVAGRHYVHLPLRGHAGTTTVLASPATAPPPTSSLVPIRWRPQDLAPAPSAGRLCVTTSGHGRICASFVVGEKPADTLTRRLESLGLRVQSSG